MAKTSIIPLPIVKGIQRQAVGPLSDAGSLYDIVNMRPNPGQYGEWMKTPSFISAEFARGTFWTSSSQTEATTSANLGTECLITLTGEQKTITVTQSVIWDGIGTTPTQVPVYEQTVWPTAVTINTQCMIRVTNVTGFALALGETLDIEIDSATTFRYRKAGGAWTAGVTCSTTGTGILTNRVYVYFQASSGFTIGHIWTWTRTDASFATTGASSMSAYPLQSVVYKDSIYYLCNVTGKVFVISFDTSDSTGKVYARSGGYRPIYGNSLFIFENHLFLGSYYTAGVAYSPMAIGNSDLNDLDCFFSTDVNEADSVILPDAPSNYIIANNKILGFAQFQGQLYAVTTSGIYYTSYLGLPIVFSFRKFSTTRWTYAPNVRHIISGPDVVYIIVPEGLFVFNGSTITRYDLPVAYFQFTTAEGFQGLTGFYTTGLYLSGREELCLLAGPNIHVFNLSLNTWYRRSVDFTVTAVNLFTKSSGKLYINATSRKFFEEDTLGEKATALDGTAGTVYTPGSIVFQPTIYSTWSNVKEVSSAYICHAQKYSGSSDYASLAETQIQLYWKAVTSPEMDVVTSYDTDATAILTSTSTTGSLDFPRLSFRGIVFKIVVQSTNAAKPVFGRAIYAFEPQIRGVETVEI